ncbi:MAG: M15 family metallopeptidase, partial [Campylobacterota bacterium]|nr:M15 family metallopeptidase [Campylobacterota bacterium]
MRIVSLFIMLSLMLWSNEFFDKISPIDSHLKQQMIKGNSYRNGCPVKLKDLRYVEVAYHDFEGRYNIGELIVHRSVANEVVNIFRELYEIEYPIAKMELISHYNGSDFASIEADNTSAFNCRFIGGTKRWSNHAFGKAIDINPLENPYISRKGTISHKRSLKYRKRVHQNNSSSDRAMLLSNDNATKIFKKYGWIWGGDWNSIKDYQHFEKRK